MTFLIGYEDAFMGTVRQFNNSFAVYDYEKVIESLMHSMSREDAEEYFEFNIAGSWVGDDTPGFFTKEDADALNHHRH